jgi:SWI/SNF-related matrix-associated actin-dependent regulator of chromatin subfamily A member 5
MYISNIYFFLSVFPLALSYREYQLEGLNWMIRLHENGINGILADEMGLGKTLQSISILSYLYEYKNVTGPHLVMVPKSTLSNWCNEFARFAPAFRVLRFHGNKEERQALVDTHLKPIRMRDDDREWDVLITTYEILNLEKAPLSKLAWRYLIIDEAHRLKNEESMFAKTVRLLNTEHRLLLTGTPLQNNLHELWALLNFLLPDVFSSSEQFDEWFNLEVGDTEVKQRMISQLHKLLRPFMLRRLKADVEKSLLPKSEIILFTGMSEVQRNLYKNILRRNIDEINNLNGSNSEQSRTAILNIVMQLRKCCNHPYLFPNIEDRSQHPLGDHLFTSCGKMYLLHKLLVKMKERGHRVLIFTQMTRMLDILEDYLFGQGYLYCRIDGNTSYEDREDRIFDFNRENSDKFVFLLSTRAGGLGINLQTADTVILYDSDWNPQADLQAQDRAHRIGQKKPVQVFRLVTDDSVEVKVVERAQQKLKLDAMVVQQGRLQDKEKKMTKSDLLDTLRFGADKIFRNKESTVSDADIDLILEEGKKRTMEMNEKLQVADKGDMFDFRLDGGMEIQVFEGKDYSAKAR